MFTSLSDALHNRPFKNDYENSNRRHLIKWQKRYLSYHSQTGWKIVHLNLFQRIARSLFGCYTSTHLKRVCQQLVQEIQLNPQLIDRMRAVWQKKYPSQPCPLQSPQYPLLPDSLRNPSDDKNASIPQSVNPQPLSNTSTLSKNSNALTPLSKHRMSDILNRMQPYLELNMDKEDIKNALLSDGVTKEEFQAAWEAQEKDKATVKNKKFQQIEEKALPVRYKGLPGEWYIMETSQIQHTAPNACTSIALYTVNAILANQTTFNPHSFNQWIKEGSQAHKQQYGAAPLNRLTEEVIKDLKLNNLKTIKGGEILYDPDLIGIILDAPQTTEEFTAQMIEKAQGKPFGATLSDGLETIALYYKSNSEIYVLDSHEKTFNVDSPERVDLKSAFIAKFGSKQELDNFLFRHRYFIGQHGVNQIEARVFQ